MGVIVICVFRPKPGKDKQLVELIRSHVPFLRSLGLATPRVPIVGRAGDGSIVEVFEWESEDAVNSAHEHPAVRALWKRFEALCTYETLGSLAESAAPFPNLEPVDLGPTPGTVDWLDITVPDAAKCRRFYEGVVGYTSTAVSMGDYDDYCMVATDSRTIAGVCHARGVNADLPPVWLPYFTVSSLARSLSAVKDLGGAVVGKPRDIGNGKFCVVRDPSGAHAGLFEYKAKRR